MADAPHSPQESTRILVIGAGGFVGGYLLTHLQEVAETPIAITATVLPGSPNPPTPFPHSFAGAASSAPTGKWEASVREMEWIFVIRRRWRRLWRR
jgi:hypothetical protein